MLPRTPRSTVEVLIAGITGHPTSEEEKAIARALELAMAEEQRATAVSAWKMAGRAWATRSGILDYRMRLGRDPWPVADRLPWAGRAHEGRGGRGDSR
ncbi:MAG TPA: hypothetical protein VII47_08940 [Actinomycetota bacterium]|jgi:hypothetical protein